RRSCAVESQLRTLDGTLDKFAERPFVPRPKVVKLMPAEKQPLEAQRPENAIDRHQALWHSIVIGVLRLGGELLPLLSETADHRPRMTGKRAVREYTIKAGGSGGD